MLVRAIFEFEAQEPDELSFAVGDELEILDSTHPQWWTAAKDGKQGFIPADGFVEVIDNVPVGNGQRWSVLVPDPHTITRWSQIYPDSALVASQMASDPHEKRRPASIRVGFPEALLPALPPKLRGEVKPIVVAASGVVPSVNVEPEVEMRTHVASVVPSVNVEPEVEMRTRVASVVPSVNVEPEVETRTRVASVVPSVNVEPEVETRTRVASFSPSVVMSNIRGKDGPRSVIPPPLPLTRPLIVPSISRSSVRESESSLASSLGNSSYANRVPNIPVGDGTEPRIAPSVQVHNSRYTFSHSIPSNSHSTAASFVHSPSQSDDLLVEHSNLLPSVPLASGYQLLTQTSLRTPAPLPLPTCTAREVVDDRLSQFEMMLGKLSARVDAEVLDRQRLEFLLNETRAELRDLKQQNQRLETALEIESSVRMNLQNARDKYQREAAEAEHRQHTAERQVAVLLSSPTSPMRLPPSPLNRPFAGLLSSRSAGSLVRETTALASTVEEAPQTAATEMLNFARQNRADMDAIAALRAQLRKIDLTQQL